MITAQQAHALDVALNNLRCGETIQAAELYVVMGFPHLALCEAHDITTLAARLIGCDLEDVRN
ncbi:MAG: hypothetical protein M1522_04715 [Actinobacteria bacterium]|nr:hypothetical protein [Actinomycetota bacterium]